MMTRRESEPNFVNDIPKKYLCDLSTHILYNPVQSDCGHRLCRDCIDFGKDESCLCPVCGKRTYKKTLKSIADCKQGLLSLLVHCTLEENGCPWTGPWRQLKEHLSSCPYRMLITCQACNERFPKFQEVQHKREFCYRPCRHCGKKFLSSGIKMHQFECTEKKVAGFAVPTGDPPKLGCACECSTPCCSIYSVCLGENCVHGVTSIPVCVGSKSRRENLSAREKREEEELERETKDLIDSLDEILTLIKAQLCEYNSDTKMYISQKCPNGNDFFKEYVHWYNTSELRYLVHIAFRSPKAILKKIDEFEKKVDKFVVDRVIRCDSQIVCMKVDSQMSLIPAKVGNVHLLANRVQQALQRHTGREYKVWFCSAQQAMILELKDVVQCTSETDQNISLPSASVLPDYGISREQYQEVKQTLPKAFVASYGETTCTI